MSETIFGHIHLINQAWTMCRKKNIRSLHITIKNIEKFTSVPGFKSSGLQGRLSAIT